MEFPWSQFLGRLHPLAVHFPIALLIVAGVVELLRPRRGRPSDAGLVCLVFGSLGAMVAAWSGWEHAEHERVGRALETLLWQHRWLGVSTAVVATLTTLLALVQRRREGGWSGTAYRLGLVLSVLLVSLGGHLGGSLVYGEGYLLELLRDPSAGARATRETPPPMQARAGDPGVDDFGTAIELSPEVTSTGGPDESTPETTVPPAVVAPEPEPETAAAVPDPTPEAQPTPAVVTAPVDFATQIAPIFERSCHECHGATGRAKAGLRLTDVASLFEGAPEYALVVPGKPEASLLLELVSLPAEDLDVMPPDGDPLTADEIALLRRWIEEGATYPQGSGASATPVPAPPSEPETPPDDPEAAPAPEPTPAPTHESPAAAGDSARSAGAAPVPAPLELDDAQRAARDLALARLSERGAYAKRLSRTSEAVEVSFGLLGEAVTDADLEALAGLGPCLVSLDLSRTAVSDTGLAQLAAFPHLRRLRLDHTRVGDAGLASLAGLRELAYLNLVKTPVGDEGLLHLRGLAALRRLYLWDSAVSEAGQERLAAALPELRISRGATAVPEPAVEVEAQRLRAACCEDAASRAETCTHACCVAAAAAGEVCPTCGTPVAADGG